MRGGYLATILSTETVRKWTSASQRKICLKIGHAELFSKESTAWIGWLSLAHIVFHSLCAQPGEWKGGVPKKAACGFFPFRSRTSPRLCHVAHNLFHKICEETQTVQAGLAMSSRARLYRKRDRRCPARHHGRRIPVSRRGCLKFRLVAPSPMKSRTWVASAPFAHIVFHNLCAKWWKVS